MGFQNISYESQTRTLSSHQMKKAAIHQLSRLEPGTPPDGRAGSATVYVHKLQNYPLGMDTDVFMAFKMT
jgi:hypothetical protein